MSTARFRRERELKRLQRRLTTDPSRPILRAAERHPRPSGAAGTAGPSSPFPPGGGPGRGRDPSTAPVPTAAPPPGVAGPAGAVPPPPPADGSAFPLWARLLTLPPDLDPTYRAFLFRYIEDHIAPRDDHEHWLASRIATAMARLHLNARREPETPSPAWLRYEALAERQLRQAHRELQAHRATPTAPATGSSQPATSPAPQTSPNPPDPTFARRVDLDTLDRLFENLLAAVPGDPPTLPEADASRLGTA